MLFCFVVLQRMVNVKFRFRAQNWLQRGVGLVLEWWHGGTRWAHGCGAQCTQVWVVDTRRAGHPVDR